MTENTDNSDKSKNRDSPKEISAETESESQASDKERQSRDNARKARKDDAADSTRCRLDVRVDERGNVEVIGVTQCCPRILKQLPPIRKEFWLRRTNPELRRKIEERQEKESTQQGM